jgi:hypothetical protein
MAFPEQELMEPSITVQEFLHNYKRRIMIPASSAAENTRTQAEQRTRMVDLIRQSLTTQDDINCPIEPDAFVRFLRDVASGNQSVLPVQRGDADMEALATDILEQWQSYDSRLEQRL